MRDPRFDIPHTIPAGEPTERDVVEARNAAEELAAGPADREKLSSLPHLKAWQHFEPALVEALVKAPTRRSAWVDLFAERMECRVEHLDSLHRNEETIRSVQQEARLWTERLRLEPWAIWSTYHPEVANDWWAARMLVQLDLDRWLEVMDGFRSPSWLLSLAQLSRFWQDWELLIELLRKAPLGFLGSRPTGSPLVFVVLELTAEHLIRLDGALESPTSSWQRDEEEKRKAEKGLAAYREQELPMMLGETMTALLSREDGRRLGEHWLGRRVNDYLSRQSSIRAAAGAQEFSVSLKVVDALSAALFKAGTTVQSMRLAHEQQEQARQSFEKYESTCTPPAVGNQRDSKEREGEGARTLVAMGLPLWYGAVTVVFEDKPPDAENLEALWSWLDALLQGRDPGLRLAHHAARARLARSWIGGVLTQLSDPVGSWSASYRALEAQRRRSKHSYRYKDYDADGSSIVLVQSGLDACEFLAGEKRPESRQLFRLTEEAARRLWLTSGHGINEELRQLLANCYAYMPAIYGDELSGALAELYPKIASNTWLVCASAFSLHNNGVGATNLPEVTERAGMDLATALRDQKQWAELTQQDAEFPQNFAELAAALEVDLGLSDAETEPAAETLRRQRAALVQQLPLAGLLLEQARADGCELRHAQPLDAGGSSWLLKLQAAAALQERFGIACELRIVATRGRLTGTDLRLAQQAPEHDADPDLVVVASDRPELERRLRRVPGPWGQRVLWPVRSGKAEPLEQVLALQLPAFDLFDYRDPLRGRQLIGRQQQLQSLASRMAQGQATAIFGLRKVGKTSLALAAAQRVDPLAAAAKPFDRRPRLHATAPSDAAVVWLDAQSVLERSLDAVAERLLAALNERLPRLPDCDAPRSDVPALELERRLQQLLHAQAAPKLVIVIDEYDLLFEGLSGEPAIAGIERWLSLLRSLSQTTQRLSLILIGRDPLFVVQPTMGQVPNPCLSWVEPLWLGPLTQLEAHELLSRLGRRVGLAIGPLTADLAWSWTGGHPLLLRQLGSALLEVARSRRTDNGAPLQTDPFCEEAVAVFLARDAVAMLVREIEHLLAQRFPASLGLLQKLVQPGGDLALCLESADGEARRVLERFGILDATAPAIPRAISELLVERPAPRVARPESAYA